MTLDKRKQTPYQLHIRLTRTQIIYTKQKAFHAIMSNFAKRILKENQFIISTYPIIRKKGRRWPQIHLFFSSLSHLKTHHLTFQDWIATFFTLFLKQLRLSLLPTESMLPFVYCYILTPCHSTSMLSIFHQCWQKLMVISRLPITLMNTFKPNFILSISNMYQNVMNNGICQ